MTSRIEQRLVGAIRDLTSGRGFGFIRIADGRDFFFHLSELEEGLQWERLVEGQRVSFLPVETPKGWRANQVRPVTETAAVAEEVAR